MAIHNFFQDRGFIQVHTPIITSSDCEGAGELFEVKVSQERIHWGRGGSFYLCSLFQPSGFKEKDKEFFSTTAYLTVSGQLHAEVVTRSVDVIITVEPLYSGHPEMRDTSINRTLLAVQTCQPLKAGHFTNQDNFFCPKGVQIREIPCITY